MGLDFKELDITDITQEINTFWSSNLFQDKHITDQLWRGYLYVMQNFYTQAYQLAKARGVQTFPADWVSHWEKFTFDDTTKVDSWNPLYPYAYALPTEVRSVYILRESPREISMLPAKSVIDESGKIILPDGTARIEGDSVYNMADYADYTIVCPTCGGLGVYLGNPCPTCGGAKEVSGVYSPSGIPVDTVKYLKRADGIADYEETTVALGDFICSADGICGGGVDSEQHLIAFREEPYPEQYSQYVIRNTELIYEMFGSAIGYYKKDSQSYLREVQALWYAFWNGSTFSNIESGLSVLAGIPVTTTPGYVESITEIFDEHAYVILADTSFMAAPSITLTSTPTETDVPGIYQVEISDDNLAAYRFTQGVDYTVEVEYETAFPYEAGLCGDGAGVAGECPPCCTAPPEPIPLPTPDEYGLNWSPVTSLMGDINCMYCSADGVWYAGMYDGPTSKLYRSLDGTAWTECSISGTMNEAGFVDIIETSSFIVAITQDDILTAPKGSDAFTVSTSLTTAGYWEVWERIAPIAGTDTFLLGRRTTSGRVRIVNLITGTMSSDQDCDFDTGLNGWFSEIYTYDTDKVIMIRGGTNVIAVDIGTTDLATSFTSSLSLTTVGNSHGSIAHNYINGELYVAHTGVATDTIDIRRSVDDGTTWVSLPSLSQFGQYANLEWAGGSTYVLTTNSGIYRSTDSCMSWNEEQAFGILVRGSAIQSSPAGDIAVATDSGDIYFSAVIPGIVTIPEEIDCPDCSGCRPHLLCGSPSYPETSCPPPPEVPTISETGCPPPPVDPVAKIVFNLTGPVSQLIAENDKLTVTYTDGEGDYVVKVGQVEYFIDNTLLPSVYVGEYVEAYTPLVADVKVYDYINYPEWWINYFGGMNVFEPTAQTARLQFDSNRFDMDQTGGQLDSNANGALARATLWPYHTFLVTVPQQIFFKD